MLKSIYPSGCYAVCRVRNNPAKNYIAIDYKNLKRNYPHTWEDQAEALLAHEIMHLIDWFTICHKNTDVWNTSGELLEARADELQDKIFYDIFHHKKIINP